MRNTFYLMREHTLTTIGTCAEAGDLLIVPTEEMAESLRESLRWYGHRTLRELVKENPLRNADEARGMSIEVRTLREMETFEFIEKTTMEVI